MNARQKAKRYKKELDFLKSQTIKPKIIKQEHQIVKLRARQIVENELINLKPDVIKNICAKEFVNQIKDYMEIRILPCDYSHSSIESTLWIVNPKKY